MKERGAKDYEIHRSSDSDGLAQVLEELLRQSNGDRRRQKVLRSLDGVVRLDARDINASVVLEFYRGLCAVVRRPTHGDDPEVIVSTSSAWLMAMPAVPRVAGVTNPLTREGRRFMAAVLRGEIKITGYRHVRLLRGVAVVL